MTPETMNRTQATRTFRLLLVNSLVTSVTNTFVWFAVTFWVYLETGSVIAMSVMAGVYTIAVAGSGFFLGSLVDRYPKKRVMLLSTVVTLGLYAIAALVLLVTPSSEITSVSSIALWLFVVLTLVGAIVGNVRTIAMSTLVTILVPEPERARANGLVGTSTGVSFLLASVFSGLAIGFLGVGWMLGLAMAFVALSIAHLSTLHVPDLPGQLHAPDQARDGAREGVDIAGTIREIRGVPGLFGLIFFQMFNNFLGGVFMALMDAYGLALVSVEVWGALWGVLSLGFIVGGLVVARKGLGANPVRTMMLANVVMWTVCVVFALQSWVVLLAAGIFIYLCLIPVVEASEQTILQKVIVPERQGRVFGFAQSIEQAAAPLTAFLIGPIAQLVFIPFMTDGAGVDLIGTWFGTGEERGLALVFTVAGLIGLAVTIYVMQSHAYRALSAVFSREDIAEGSSPLTGRTGALAAGPLSEDA